jgi:hypothetical protein
VWAKIKKFQDLLDALRAATVHTSIAPGTQGVNASDPSTMFSFAKKAYPPEFVMGIKRLQNVFREKRSKGQWGQPEQLPQAAAAAGSQHKSPAPATAAMQGSSSALQQAQARAPVSDNVAGAAQDAAKSAVQALPVKDARASLSSPNKMPSPGLR